MNNRDELDQMMVLEDKIVRLQIIVDESINIMHEVNNSKGLKWFWYLFMTKRFDKANQNAKNALEEMWKLKEQLWQLKINHPFK